MSPHLPRIASLLLFYAPQLTDAPNWRHMFSAKKISNKRGTSINTYDSVYLLNETTCISNYFTMYFCCCNYSENIHTYVSMHIHAMYHT